MVSPASLMQDANSLFSSNCSTICRFGFDLCFRFAKDFRETFKYRGVPQPPREMTLSLPCWRMDIWVITIRCPDCRRIWTALYVGLQILAQKAGLCLIWSSTCQRESEEETTPRAMSGSGERCELRAGLSTKNWNSIYTHSKNFSIKKESCLPSTFVSLLPFSAPRVPRQGASGDPSLFNGSRPDRALDWRSYHRTCRKTFTISLSSVHHRSWEESSSSTCVTYSRIRFLLLGNNHNIKKPSPLHPSSRFSLLFYSSDELIHQ